MKVFISYSHDSNEHAERSKYFRLRKQFENISTDLDEAREIAEAGEMRLFLADYHLEAARLAIDEGKKEEGDEKIEELKSRSEEELRIAEKMIEEMGYLRRRPEVDEIKKQLKMKK